MPALLSVEKQSLGNDTLYMAVCYYFQMNGILLLGYITYRNLSRLWNLPTASIDMILLQVESNGQKHPGWCSTDCHSSRKPEGPRPRCERKDQLQTIHHWACNLRSSAQSVQEQAHSWERWTICSPAVKCIPHEVSFWLYVVRSEHATDLQETPYSFHLTFAGWGKGGVEGWWWTPSIFKTCSELFCHLDDGAFAKIHVGLLSIVVTKLGLASSNIGGFFLKHVHHLQ